MSIHNLPPLTQTSEPTSGEVTSVANISRELGRESVWQVLHDPEYEKNGDVVFINHESLQAAITRTREEELAAVDAEIAKQHNAVAVITAKLAVYHDRSYAIQGYIDDLGLVDDLGATRRQFNGQSHVSTMRYIQGLETALKKAHNELERLGEERGVIIAKLEDFEREDFMLLQKGR